MSPSLQEVLSRLPDDVEFVHMEGHKLTLRTRVPLPTVERGHLLLDLEKRLRREVGPIEVFLQPRGDMNKLRTTLRGVKV